MTINSYTRDESTRRIVEEHPEQVCFTLRAMHTSPNVEAQRMIAAFLLLHSEAFDRHKAMQSETE